LAENNLSDKQLVNVLYNAQRLVIFDIGGSESFWQLQPVDVLTSLQRCKRLQDVHRERHGWRVSNAIVRLQRALPYVCFHLFGAVPSHCLEFSDYFLTTMPAMVVLNCILAQLVLTDFVGLASGAYRMSAQSFLLQLAVVKLLEEKPLVRKGLACGGLAYHRHFDYESTFHRGTERCSGCSDLSVAAANNRPLGGKLHYCKLQPHKRACSFHVC
jgi:hypothetical protein